MLLWETLSVVDAEFILKQLLEILQLCDDVRTAGKHGFGKLFVMDGISLG